MAWAECLILLPVTNPLEAYSGSFEKPRLFLRCRFGIKGITQTIAEDVQCQ
jgi:hypothetical protein